LKLIRCYETSRATLAPLYEQLARHSVFTVKAETIATLLERKIDPKLAQEIGITSGVNSSGFQWIEFRGDLATGCRGVCAEDAAVLEPIEATGARPPGQATGPYFTMAAPRNTQL
jgi:hypothetical protein